MHTSLLKLITMGEHIPAHKIRGARNAYIAKDIGRKVKGDGSWDLVKVSVMRSLLQRKFEDTLSVC